MCTNALIKYRGSCCTRSWKKQECHKRVREEYQNFQEHLEVSRRDGGSIQEAHEYTPRRSFLDDVDIIAEESMDYANAFYGRQAEAPGG